MSFMGLRALFRMRWPKGDRPTKKKDDGFVDVPLREGEISHKVKGNEHKVVLRAMAVCHYCRAPIAKLGDPCPYNYPGYTEAVARRG